ncbi:type II secretion system protein [Novimethylophilus kurashikiensis]|uniref:Type II secretion system protein n=1 Tax=Novimethylophilus kurashikiensis TaxID=1825523 RepID=A0A2R5F8N7_9PROT|nr:type II secretion system F family protein [Novimethylophilus kurashikiensis]GBG14610.1 type II secretion system protein [Novimethylophilus kurashikiensis]
MRDANAQVVYRNYRVKYLAEEQMTPTATRDPVNPELWVCEDIIPATSPDGALQQAIARGGVPISAKLVRQVAGQIPQDYKIKFLMSIMFSVQSGVSVGAAMERTIESEQWPLRGKLDPALRLLRAGATFSEAITLLGMYDETTLAILSAGEHTGTMQQALATALQHLQRKSTADGLMKGAVGAILLDVFMAATSCLSNVIGIIPQAVKTGVQTKDPVVLAHWDHAVRIGYVSNYLLLGGATIALLFALVAWANYEYGGQRGRERVEGFLRKLPFLGTALVHDGMSTSTSIAGHLLKGGVLFTSAMEITARTVRLPLVRNYWKNVLSMTLGGAPTSSALAREPLTSAEQRVVASHTNSTQLAEAFTQIAEYRQQQAAKDNKKFIFSGLIISFLYSALGIASTLYVNYIQITSIMSGSSI